MTTMIKRSVALVAILALVLSAMCVPTALASGTRSYTTTCKCAMRTQPDAHYAKVAVVPAGVTLNATSSTRDEDGRLWVYASYNGCRGWVCANGLKRG